VASIDCQFGDWGPWLPCTRWDSSSCHGFQERARTYQDLLGDGKACDGSLRERTGCVIEPDPAAGILCSMPTQRTDCRLSQWTEWGPCSDECLRGQSTRERKILVAPTNGGSPCEDPLEELKACSPVNPEINPACKKDKDCAWDEWSEWSVCRMCGDSQRRHRDVQAYQEGSGRPCQEANTIELGGDCTHLCGVAAGEARKAWCHWEGWSLWSVCSSQCGPGRRERTRSLAGSHPPVPEQARLFENEGPHHREVQDVEDLERERSHIQMHHTQELCVAFSAGMLSLLALFSISRLCGRSLRQPHLRTGYVAAFSQDVAFVDGVDLSA
jgi:hypothetical protein